MNRKGFTLVELLGVMVVLGLILITSVPAIIQTFKTASERENNLYLTRLYAAAETYLEIRRDSFDQLDTVGGYVDIPIQSLIDEGLVKTLGTDPITSQVITASDTVTATKESDGTISYELYFEDTNLASYNQTGLVMHLDAIYNTGYGHSNTATIWSDLASSHSDGRLTNFNYTSTSGWSNNGLIFDGSNDLVVTRSDGFDFSTLKSGQAFSIGVTFKTNTITSWDGVLSNMTSWGNGGLTILYGTSNNTGIGMGTYLVNGSAATTNTVYNVYAVYSGTVMSLYINGSYVGQTTYSVTAGNSVLTLGCFYTTPNLLTDGTIRTVMVYNRALNLSEVQNNYTLDTNRYR